MYSHTDVMHRVIHPHSDIHTQIMYIRKRCHNNYGSHTSVEDKCVLTMLFYTHTVHVQCNRHCVLLKIFQECH